MVYKQLITFQAGESLLHNLFDLGYSGIKHNVSLHIPLDVLWPALGKSMGFHGGFRRQ